MMQSKVNSQCLQKDSWNLPTHLTLRATGQTKTGKEKITGVAMRISATKETRSSSKGTTTGIMKGVTAAITIAAVTGAIIATSLIRSVSTDCFMMPPVIAGIRKRKTLTLVDAL